MFQRVHSISGKGKEATYLFATPPSDDTPKRQCFTSKELDFMTPLSKGHSPSVLSQQDLNSPGSIADSYILNVDKLSVSSTGRC